MQEPIYSNNHSNFKAKWLLPNYWHLWLGLFLWYMLAIIPKSKWVAKQCIALLTNILYAHDGKKAFSVARRNISLCFPYLSHSQKKKMYENYIKNVANNVLDYPKIALYNTSIQNAVIYKNYELLERNLKKNKGVFLVTAHTLCCDYALNLLHRKIQRPGICIYRPVESKLLQWVHNTVRTSKAKQLLLYPRNNKLLIAIKNCIQKGGLASILIDESFTSKHSIKAPFFSQNKTTLVWINRFLHQTKAELLGCYSSYDNEANQYITEFFEIGALPYDQYDVGVKINRAIEKMIISSPESYLWKLRYFRKD